MDSDHKPLETIFGKPLATAPRRCLKMVRGQSTKPMFEEELDQVPLIGEINQIIATGEKLSKLKAETEKDEVLQQVKEVIQAGWPGKRVG